jgi:CxxC motif-containing protein (DUF1111 family)
MGLREAVQKAAYTAVQATGNVPDVVTYGSQTYTAGQMTGTTNVTVSAIRIEFDIAKVDGVNVKLQDRQYLIASLALGVIVPAENDTLTVGSEIWTVTRVTTDPAGAAYLLHVRR